MTGVAYIHIDVIRSVCEDCTSNFHLSLILSVRPARYTVVYVVKGRLHLAGSISRSRCALQLGPTIARWTARWMRIDYWPTT